MRLISIQKLMAPCAALLLVACGPSPGGTDSAAGTTSGTSESGDPPTGTSVSGSTTTPAPTTTTTTAASGPTPTTDTASETAAATTVGPAGPECQQDSDCVIVDDCCECDAKPADAVALCDTDCDQSLCDAAQITGVTAACRSGVCEFANVQCSEGPVDCDLPQPQCPEGTRNSVKDGCWGPCVPPRYCEGATCPPGDGCGDGWMCVESQCCGSRCAVIPLACDGAPTCDCAWPYLGEFCQGGCEQAGDSLLCADGG